jgi:hypothetical protein
MDRAPQTFEPTAGRPLDVGAIATRQLTEQVGASPLRDARLLGPFRLAGNATIDIDHGLGRAAAAVLPCLSVAQATYGGPLGNLADHTADLPAAARNSQVRIKNIGVTPSTFMLLVL